jgi:ABC-type glycerol-3-phosphate transport system permease component
MATNTLRIRSVRRTPRLRRAAPILAAFALGLVALLYLYPFLWMAGSSLKSDREFFARGPAVLPAETFHWENYSLAWERANFSSYFLNTSINAALTVLFSVLFTSLAAFTLARLRIPGSRWLLGLITVSLFLPRGYTILPVIEIMKALGLLNTRWPMIILYTAGNMIFGTFLYYGYMRVIPTEIEEAAILDGASPWQRYWRVILPLSAPMTGTVALFAFLGAWNELFTALVFTFGAPELRTLAVGIYAFVGERKVDWTLMCAAGIISIAPVVLLFCLMQRQFVTAFTGSIKS